MKVRNGLVFVSLAALLAAVLVFAAGTTEGREFSAKGGNEKEVSLEDVPAPVKALILDQAGGNKITEVEMASRGKMKIYEAEWVVGDKEVEVEIAYVCTLIRKSIEPAEGEGEEDDDDGVEDDDGDESDIKVIKERDVSFNQTPAPGREGLLKKAGKNRVHEIEEIYTNKGLFYEAEWIDGEWEVEVVLTDKGALFCMEMELICDDDDDDDDDDD